jgi:hypothetical protein
VKFDSLKYDPGNFVNLDQFEFLKKSSHFCYEHADKRNQLSTEMPLCKLGVHIVNISAFGKDLYY